LVCHSFLPFRCPSSPLGWFHPRKFLAVLQAPLKG
jgi:hypothetical protein